MSNPDELLSQAIASHQAGDLARACEAYQEVLRLQPAQADAWHLLGVVLHQTGRHEQAIELIRRAVALKPTEASYHGNLALIFKSLGRFDEAIDGCRRALALDPGLVVAHNCLGLALRDQGRLDESIVCYRRALALQPKSLDLLNNLGNCLRDSGRLTESIQILRDAIAMEPMHAESFGNLACSLIANDDWDAASECCERAIELKGDYWECIFNLGLILQRFGRLESSQVHLERFCEQLPPPNSDKKTAAIRRRAAEAFSNLGAAYKDEGRLHEAGRCFRKSLAIFPSPQIHSNLLLCMVYDPTCSSEQLFSEHLEWANRYAHGVASSLRHDNLPDPNRRLRVGYVSGDFRAHAVATFVLPMLESHNRECVEVYCYSNNSKNDEVTERVRRAADHWRTISEMSDEEAERRIRDDKIDLLIDLSGHTAGHRLTLFARKPAPVQVTFIGYPATTGLSQMDYRFTDETLTPCGEASQHTETLYWLKGGTACFSPLSECQAPSELPALKTGRLTFGSPHNPAKLNDEVIRLWAKVLRAAPNSRMIAFRDCLQGPAREVVFERFLRNGIAKESFELRNVSAATHGYDEYMKQYDAVDICLDTFPANAGTTACESLWMGVPWLTLYGERFFGRQTACVMSRIGLSDWVSHSAQELVERAVYWSCNLDRLANVRREIRPRFQESPLGCKAKFTRFLEDAYRDIWSRWCRGN